VLIKILIKEASDIASSTWNSLLAQIKNLVLTISSKLKLYFQKTAFGAVY